MPPQITLSDFDEPDNRASAHSANAAYAATPPAQSAPPAAGGSDLHVRLAAQQKRAEELEALQATAPAAPVGLREKAEWKEGTRTKESLNTELSSVRANITSILSQIKTVEADVKTNNARPTSEYASGELPAKPTKQQILSKAGSDIAAGVDTKTLILRYGSFGWMPPIGDDDPPYGTINDSFYLASASGKGGGGGSGGSGRGGSGASGIAAAGALLRAQLQNAIQEKRIKLDTAKAISKDYFDALTEARQREEISQDAFNTAQRANSDYLLTERTKMDLLSPENTKLFQSGINSLGSTSGSSFRIPDSWVESQSGVQVNADVLGGNYATQQPKDIQAILEGAGRTPSAIDQRILAGAAATNGGARPNTMGDVPFTAGPPDMTPEEAAEVEALLRGMGVDPMGDITAGDNTDDNGLGDLGE